MRRSGRHNDQRRTQAAPAILDRGCYPNPSSRHNPHRCALANRSVERTQSPSSEYHLHKPAHINRCHPTHPRTGSYAYGPSDCHNPQPGRFYHRSWTGLHQDQRAPGTHKVCHSNWMPRKAGCFSGWKTRRRALLDPGSRRVVERQQGHDWKLVQIG